MAKRFRLKGTKKSKSTRVRLKKQKLVIIDGHSQLYRAFYSQAPDMTMHGIPTKVIYMFLSMLFSTLKELKPSHLAVCFDGPTKDLWRTDLYPDYKGNRSHSGEEFEDFFKQVKVVKDMMNALKIVNITGIKHEADDLIATIAERAMRETELDVVVVSRDKDIEQIITKRVTMYDPQDQQYRTVESVTEKRGFGPGLVARYLTIAGDVSDNLPGVKGIGEVGAKKLLLKYNNIGNIYAHLDDMTPGMRSKLEAARGDMALFVKLVTLDRCAELPFAIEDLKFKGPDYAAAKPLFRRYGFRKLSTD